MDSNSSSLIDSSIDTDSADSFIDSSSMILSFKSSLSELATSLEAISLPLVSSAVFSVPSSLISIKKPSQ